jgi:hypothetical protein
LTGFDGSAKRESKACEKEVFSMTSDHGHTEPHTHEPAGEPRTSGWTGYALAKYGIILLIVIVVLWFVANYFLGE